MPTVITYDAKASLSAIIEQVLRTHEEVIITRHGKPVVKLVEVKENAWKPNFGPLPLGLRANCTPEEAIAPVFPNEIPWSETDPA